ncbi:hypothetical protein BaRGS_00022404, partial [Batillaria attramentaria]
RDVPNVEILKASSCGLRDIDLPRLDHLRELDISQNKIPALPKIQQRLPSLERLNVSSCRLSDISLVAMEHLKVLDLNNPLLNHLDAEFQSYLKTSGIHSLQYLFLSNTGITGIEADPFADMRKSGTGINVHLDITRNNITKVDENMHWTKFGVLKTSDISICCAYYSAVKKTDCRTGTERIFPEQCNASGRHVNSESIITDGLSSESPGCDVGWQLYESFCFRFVLPIHKISASKASNECREKFQAGLAALPTQASKQIAAHFMELSPHEELIVGLERFHVASDGLRHLYRFLWHWSQGGTAFDGPDFTTGLNCATYRPRASGNGLKTIDCQEEAEYAYVCSKKNSEKLRSESHTAFTLPTPSPRPTVNFPTTACEDDTFVHKFHFCRFTGRQASFTVKSSLFFYCRNGRRVHYTLTCDGVYDCGDRSDEEQCQAVRSEPLLTSSFLCTRQTQLVDKSYRCDGVPDCHDGSDEEKCDVCSQGLVLCGGFGCLPEHVCRNSRVLRPQSFVFLSENKTLQQVDFDKYGYPILSTVQACPDSHLECKGGYCIPTFLINNGV